MVKLNLDNYNDYFLNVDFDKNSTHLLEMQDQFFKKYLNPNRESLKTNKLNFILWYLDFLLNILKKYLLYPLYPCYPFLKDYLEYLIRNGYFFKIFNLSQILVVILDYIDFFINICYEFMFWSRKGKIYGLFKIILRIFASPTFLLKILLIGLFGDKVMETRFFVQINNFRPFLTQCYTPVHQIFYLKAYLNEFLNSCSDPTIKVLLETIFNNFSLILCSHALFAILKGYFEKIDKYLSKRLGLDAIEMHQYIKDKKSSNPYIKFLEKYTHILDQIARSILLIYGLSFVAYLIKITDFRKLDLFKFFSAIYQIQRHYERQIICTLPIFICAFFFYQLFKLIKNNLIFVLYFFLYLILVDLFL